MTSRFVQVATAETTAPDVFHVRWWTEQEGGSLSVSLQVEKCSDPGTLAELWALRHLLLDAQVAGTDRSGGGLTLIVSRGAVRKLVLKKSSKKDLIKYTHWLGTRFASASIEVDSKARQQAAEISSPQENITVSDGDTGEDLLDAPGLGPVKLTRHVIDQYMDRAGTVREDRAWRRIKHRLQKGMLFRHHLPPAVAKQKKLTYKERQAEHWRNDAGWVFVFTPPDDQGVRTLMTMFRREDD